MRNVVETKYFATVSNFEGIFRKFVFSKFF